MTKRNPTASASPPPRVFASYAHEDQRLVHELSKLLRALGHDVFIDLEAILPGDDLARTISAGLTEATTVLVFWTRNAARSSWVAREIDYALERGKRVIPVLLDDVSMHAKLMHLRYADLRRERSQQVRADRIASAVRSIVAIATVAAIASRPSLTSTPPHPALVQAAGPEFPSLPAPIGYRIDEISKVATPIFPSCTISCEYAVRDAMLMSTCDCRVPRATICMCEIPVSVTRCADSCHTEAYAGVGYHGFPVPRREFLFGHLHLDHVDGFDMPSSIYAPTKVATRALNVENSMSTPTRMTSVSNETSPVSVAAFVLASLGAGLVPILLQRRIRRRMAAIIDAHARGYVLSEGPSLVELIRERRHEPGLRSLYERIRALFPMSSRPRVFISYSPGSSSDVERIGKWLGQNGVNIGLDVAFLRGDALYASERAFRRSDVVLAVFGDGPGAEHMALEINVARTRGVAIVPVLLDGAHIDMLSEPELRFLRTIHSARLSSESFDNDMRTLLKAIRAASARKR